MDRTYLWVCGAPHTRKSYDGLTALAKHHLGEDPLSGALFVFVNRRRTQLKRLYFDRTGYCIWSKRLEAGRFKVDWDRSGKQAIDLMTLRLILEGLTRERFKQQRRYRRPPAHVTSNQLTEEFKKSWPGLYITRA